MGKQSFIDLLNELKDIKEQQKELSNQEKLIKQKLQAEIPANEQKAGVFHKVTQTKNISYGKALDEVVRELVPKTRRSQVDFIIKRNTSFNEKHQFKIV